MHTVDEFVPSTCCFLCVSGICFLFKVFFSRSWNTFLARYDFSTHVKTGINMPYKHLNYMKEWQSILFHVV